VSFKTECNECIFNTQGQKVNCLVNRFNKFEKKGMTKDGTITGLCSMCRNKDWMTYIDSQLSETDLWYMNDVLDTADVIAFYQKKVEHELKSHYAYLIYDNQKDGKVLERLKNSLSAFPSIIPCKFILSFVGTDEETAQIADYFSKCKEFTNISYTIKCLYEETYENEIIDYGMEKTKGIYTIVQKNNGHNYFIENTNLIYNFTENALEKFILVSDSRVNFENFAVLNIFYRSVKGFEDADIFEKLDLLYPDKPWAVRTWKELKEIYESNSINS